MISSSAQFPGPDVDECTFPGPDALTSEFPGVDFAVVSFPPAPMPVIEGVAHFTGVGYLTVDVFGIAKAAALFAGSGSATADSIAWGGVKQATATFTGSGDFAVLARAVQRAAYSGSGSLAAKIAAALAVTLSGSGQSAFTSSAIGIAPFALSGEGTATATVIAVGGAYSVSANFTGEGSATAKVVPAVTAAFNGSGSASAAVASAIKSLFNGSGQDTAKVVSAVKAGFTGSGTASATMVPGFTPSGMTKNTSAQNWTGTAAFQVTGMVAESGSTLSGSALLPNGSKTGATVTAQVSISATNFMTSITAELRKNGTLVPGGTVTVSTSSTSTATLTIPTRTVDVVGTDQFTIWVTPGGATGGTVAAGVNTYVRIT
ncbi:hypothetical protein QNA23_20595 [Rhodococcus erythropolis]|uniref:hypothetical protein n=1 Tax=Rhodococcus erythropolis TaxID=1833 RepID=UPI0024BA0211|nr:hypothetical protein [Rhodococcus erythropolis]MDJ0405905.1 hypothetical protein [Rhodococcus erythropolis]